MSVFHGAERVASADAPAKDLESMTKAELIAYAREHGVAVSTRDSKAAILRAIKR